MTAISKDERRPRPENLSIRWRDRLYTARNRILGNPRFQRWAAAFPFTRRVARREARALFDLCAGFVYSQVLFTCVRLKLFELLAREPMAHAEIARRLSLSNEAATCLLEAAASLRLLERRDRGRFGLGVLGAALLANPSIAAMIEHHALLYADLQDPVALLRGQCAETQLASYWAYANAAQPNALEAGDVDRYTALMSASQALIADDVLDAYALGNHRCLLDVGGGDGAFLVAAAKHATHLRLQLFDLPAVAARAKARFEATGLAERAVVFSGDIFSDDLPRGADIVSLVRVLHDHDDAEAQRILGAVRLALTPGGRVLIAEPMAGTPGAEGVGAYFGFYLLAMGSGRPRTPDELTAMLRSAGFRGMQLLHTRRPMLTRVLIADV